MTSSSDSALHEIPENLLEQGAVLRWLVDTDPANPRTSERIARARLENQLWCATKAQVAHQERGIVLLAVVLCLLVGYPIDLLFATDWFDQARIAGALVLLAWFLKVRVELGFGAACDVVTDAQMERLVREPAALRCAPDRVTAIRASLDAACPPELEQRARRAGWRKALHVWDWSHSRRLRHSPRGFFHHVRPHTNGDEARPANRPPRRNRADMRPPTDRTVSPLPS